MRLAPALLCGLAALVPTALHAQVAPTGTPVLSVVPETPLASAAAGFATPPSVPSGTARAVGATWTVQAADPASGAVTSVAGAGDLNGDGYEDVAVGVWYQGLRTGGEGSVQVYLGGVSGLATTPSFVLPAPAGSFAFGFSVAAAGDVNRDGYGDLVVGAPGDYASESTYGGAVYLYLGGPRLSATPHWTIRGDQVGGYWGYAVAGAGDVNGDGYADVAASAPFYDKDATNDGLVSVFYGSPGARDISPDYSLWGGTSNNMNLGKGLAFVGDVNGDGFGDLAMGAPGYVVSATRTGLLALATGSSTGLLASRVKTLVQEGQVGFANALAAVPNFGGRRCIAVGTHLTSSDGDIGVYCLAANYTAFGRFDNRGWGQSYGTGYGLGYALAPSVDLDGDGTSDVVGGLPYYNTGNGTVSQGAVFTSAGEAGLTLVQESYTYTGRTVGTALRTDATGHPMVLASSGLGGKVFGQAFGAAPPAATVSVQLVQNSTGIAQFVGAIDVYVDGVLKASRLGLGQATPFVSLTGGARVSVSFTPAGQPASAGRTVPIDVPPAGRYTVSLTGTPDEVLALYANPYNRDLTLRLVQVTRVDPATAPALGKVGAATANLYVFHAVTDAPPLTLLLGADTLAARLDYGEASAPVALAPGTYTVSVYAAGAGGAALRSLTVTIPGDAAEVNLSLVGVLHPAQNAGAPALTGVAVTPAGTVVATAADESARPEAAGVRLGVPAPNPARGAASVTFALGQAGRATVEVYDVLGRRVATPFDGVASAGETAVRFGADALAPGVYVLRLTTDAGAATRTFTVAR